MSLAPEYPDTTPYKGNRYQMIADGKEEWLSIFRAGVRYDNGWITVGIGEKALLPDGSTRDVTDEERRVISEIADEYSASK